ncbi:hypothetical protein ABEB36_013028 [Hypothenemus hampei]|uniref:Uncharacterized protein n=1 Tax=Hypothenemus hampei TaxID=57062 RepID=A0ABD1E6K0_HYPHA
MPIFCTKPTPVMTNSDRPDGFSPLEMNRLGLCPANVDGKGHKEPGMDRGKFSFMKSKDEKSEYEYNQEQAPLPDRCSSGNEKTSTFMLCYTQENLNNEGSAETVVPYEAV